MSKNIHSNVFELYSKEIEDNKRNENREAELLNLSNKIAEEKNLCFENRHPISIVSATNTVGYTTQKNTGAIPKKAFSYLNNEQDIINIKNRFILKNKVNRSRPDTEFIPTVDTMENDRNTQELNPANSSSVLKTTDLESNLSQTADISKENEISKVTISPNVAPGKLKPEAFAFLSSVANPKSKWDCGMVRTDEEVNRRLSLENAQLFKRVLEPLIPHHSQDNGSFHDTTLPPNVCSIGKLPASATNHPVSSENTKPPLPVRPPPIHKYSPEIFKKPTIRPKESNTGVQSHDVNKTVNLAEKQIELLSDMRINLHPENFDGKGTVGKSLHKETIAVIEASSTNGTPTSSLAIPLPSVPLSPATVSILQRLISKEELSKHTISTKVSKVGNITSNCQKEISADKPMAIENQIDVLQDQHLLNSGLVQVIGNQVKVNREIFNSQKPITAAIASRQQDDTLEQTMGESWGGEDINYRRTKTRRTSDLDMAAKRPDTPSPIESTSQETVQEIVKETEQQIAQETVHGTDQEIAKETAHGRKEFNINPCKICRATDIISIQNAMSRPSLPQKARPPQRSVSCSSLVQTFKDLSSSIWNQGEKNKRHSDGPSSSRNTGKEKDATKRSRCLTVSSLAINATDDNSKGSSSKEKDVQLLNNDADLAREKKKWVSYPWYHDVDARTGQIQLLSFAQDGAFLIRPSSKPTKESPHTLCLLCEERVFNLHVRQKPNKEYALGLEKTGERTFPSLNTLIKFHQEVPIEIRPIRGAAPPSDTTRIFLRVTPPK